jgi:hypothetical protein
MKKHGKWRDVMVQRRTPLSLLARCTLHVRAGSPRGRLALMVTASSNYRKARHQGVIMHRLQLDHLTATHAVGTCAELDIKPSTSGTRSVGGRQDRPAPSSNPRTNVHGQGDHRPPRRNVHDAASLRIELSPVLERLVESKHVQEKHVPNEPSDYPYLQSSKPSRSSHTKGT